MLPNMVAAHVITEHLKCVPSVTEKLNFKFYLVFFLKIQIKKLNLRTDFSVQLLENF